MPMSLLDHLEHLRAKPEHIRKRIAFFTASGVTLAVALLWMVSFTMSDTLALDSQGVPTNLSTVNEGTRQDFSTLLGAANAFQSAVEEGPGVEVVETNASSTIEEQTPEERTVIPF